MDAIIASRVSEFCMPDMSEALRRIITGDDASGKSLIILDGPPSSSSGTPETGGLFDIWHDVVDGTLKPRDHMDLGPSAAQLSPDPGRVKVRWFIINPADPAVTLEQQIAGVRARFREFGAEDHLTDQTRHPAMHKTETLDVICLLQGDVTLVLDGETTRVKPGQVVIQRGTSHGWQAHGGPALLLAVLIDRPLA